MTGPRLHAPKIPPHAVVHFLRYIAAIIVVGIAAGVSIGLLLYASRVFAGPISRFHLDFLFAVHPGYVYVAVSVIAAILVFRILGGMISHYVVPRANRTVGVAVLRSFYLVAAVLILLGVLSYEGISATDIAEILTTAGFLGIVLGLAAQSTIGNFLGALAIIASRPFDVGDRITFVLSSYGLLPTTYPHETQPSGHTGTVYDIGMIYTMLIGDDDVPFSVANGQLVQSLIINHTRAGHRRVRLRISVPKSASLDNVKKEIQSALAGLPGMSKEGPEIRLISLTPDGFDMVVVIPMEGTDEETLRGRAVERLLRLHQVFAVPAG